MFRQRDKCHTAVRQIYTQHTDKCTLGQTQINTHAQSYKQTSTHAHTLSAYMQSHRYTNRQIHYGLTDINMDTQTGTETYINIDTQETD